ncbi:MAG: manganese efflux pump [Kofleriaceae bacterium]|nr:manganese efflux pump [Kofleriaceae bacterium]
MLHAFLLALALAMDATAVALTRGLVGARREIFLVPMLFCGFQAGMAGVGLALGHAGQGLVGSAKLWIAAGLLLIVGVRMAIGGFRSKTNTAEPATAVAAIDASPAPSLILLITLALATSIDAAAAGATLPTLAVTPIISIILIGLVTMACSAVAIVAGRKLRRRGSGEPTPWFEIAGGAVLVGLAFKTAYAAATL